MDKLDQSDDFTGGAPPYSRTAARAAAAAGVTKPVKARRRNHAASAASKARSSNSLPKKTLPSALSDKQTLSRTSSNSESKSSENSFHLRKTAGDLGKKKRALFEGTSEVYITKAKSSGLSKVENTVISKAEDAASSEISIPEDNVMCKANNLKHLGVSADSSQKLLDLIEDSEEESENKDTCFNSLEVDTLKHCQFCGQDFDVAVYQEHLKTCLRQKYSRNSRKKEKSENVLCQICQLDITSLSANDRNGHVNDCIDGNKPGCSASTQVTSGSGAASNSTEQVENEEYAQRRDWFKKAHNSDLLMCPICSMDLSTMLTSGRMLHFNACVDTKERATRKKSKPKETSVKEKVLDCPICGKSLKTQNSRKTHMKTCAKKLNVDTATLLARISQQEEEHKQRHSAVNKDVTKNTAVSDVITLPTAVSKTRKGGSSRSARNVPKDAPRPTCFDRVMKEQTEFALALSNSLVEKGSGETAAGSGNGEQVKNAYAILMSPSNKTAPAKKAKKKHKDPEFTPALLVETKEEMSNKLARKVAQIMSGSQEGTISSTPSFNTSDLAARYQHADQESNHGVQKALWAVSQIDPDNISLEKYYVSKITPPVEICPTVDKAKAKEVTMKISGETLQERDYLNQTRTANETMNDSIYPSTQSAVLLAQLAADDTTLRLQDHTICAESDSTKMKTSEPEIVNISSQFLVKEPGMLKEGNDNNEEPSGYIESLPGSTKTEVRRIAEKALLARFISLVDREDGSDVIIHAADNSTLRAHSFMLNLRCPELLKVCKDGKVDLSTERKEVVTLLMRYVYGADVDFPAPSVIKLCHLAERFRLDELKNICDAMIEENGIQYPRDNQALNETADETLQHLLKKVWGSDSESDTDTSDVGSNQTDIDSRDRENGEALDEDEYNEVMDVLLTQRITKRLASAKESDSEEELSQKQADFTPDHSESESPAKQEKYRISNFMNLNMTLHEQMTRALFNANVSVVESESGQSETSSDSEQSGNSPESGDGAVSRNEESEERNSDSESLSVMEVQLKSLPQNIDVSSVYTPVSKENEKKDVLCLPKLGNDMTFLLEQEQGKGDHINQHISNVNTPKSALTLNESMTPDLFQDSPEFGSIKSDRCAQSNYGCTTDRFSKSLKESAWSSDVTAFSKCNDSVIRNSPGKDSMCDVDLIASRDNSEDERHSPKNESDECEIIQSQELGNLYLDGKSASPVIQTQASQPNPSQQIPVVQTKKVVRNLSKDYGSDSKDNYSMSFSHEAMTSKLVTSDPFSKSVLYNSTSKYSPKHIKEVRTRSPEKRKRRRSSTDSSNNAQEASEKKRRNQNSSPASPPVSLNQHRFSFDVSDPTTPKRQSQRDVNDQTPERIPSSQFSNQSCTTPIQTGSQTSHVHNEGDESRIIDLTYESEEEKIGRKSESQIDTENADLNTSHEIPFVDNAEVWNDFEDDGFNEACFENPISQHSITNSQDGATRELQNIRKGTSLNCPQNSSFDVEDMADIDLGSSFSQSVPSQDQRPFDEDMNHPSEDGHLQSSLQQSVRSKDKPSFEGLKNSSIDSDIKTHSLNKRMSGEKKESSKTSKFKFKSTKSTVTQEQQNVSQVCAESSSSSNVKSSKSCQFKHSRISKSRSTHSMSDSSPECDQQSNRSTRMGKKQDAEDKEEYHPYGKDRKNVGESEDEYDPPTDVSMNVSTLSKDALSDKETSPRKDQNSFKTPGRVAKPKKKKLTEWQPPSPFTPMPDYSTLPTPHIQRQAEKIGLRHFPKKRMVALLKNIYDAGHQYETDPEFDEEELSEVRRKLPVVENDNGASENATVAAAQRGKTAAKRGRKPKASPSTHSAVDKKSTTSTSSPKPRKTVSKDTSKSKRRDQAGNAASSQSSTVCGEDYEADASSSDSRLNTSMDNSDCDEVLEETVLENSPSKLLSKRDVAYKRNQMWDFLQKRDDMLAKILHYEPMEFDDFHSALKAAGLTSVGTNIVSEFLDDKGIPYTMRKLRQEKPSRQKKRKPKKTVSASQSK